MSYFWFADDVTNIIYLWHYAVSIAVKRKILYLWLWCKIFFATLKQFNMSRVSQCCVGDKVKQFSKSVKYLGVLLNDNLSDNDDIQRQMRSVYGTANWLKYNFFKCSKKLKKFLFNQYCTSLYASQLCCKFILSSMHHLRVTDRQTLLFAIDSNGRKLDIKKNQQWRHCRSLRRDWLEFCV